MKTRTDSMIDPILSFVKINDMKMYYEIALEEVEPRIRRYRLDFVNENSFIVFQLRAKREYDGVTDISNTILYNTETGETLATINSQGLDLSEETVCYMFDQLLYDAHNSGKIDLYTPFVDFKLPSYEVGTFEFNLLRWDCTAYQLNNHTDIRDYKLKFTVSTAEEDDKDALEFRLNLRKKNIGKNDLLTLTFVDEEDAVLYEKVVSQIDDPDVFTSVTINKFITRFIEKNHNNLSWLKCYPKDLKPVKSEPTEPKLDEGTWKPTPSDKLYDYIMRHGIKHVNKETSKMNAVLNEDDIPHKPLEETPVADASQFKHWEPKTNLNDIIHNPSHYQLESGKQAWDILRDTMTKEQYQGYLAGNVLKYILRHSKKNGKQDLEKAMVYLKKLTEVSYPEA